MRHDCGRAEVYAAELAAFDGTDLETPRTLEEIRGVIAAVVAGPWWPGPPVQVVAARRGSTASSARNDGDGGAVIRFAAGQLTIATAAHELAHVLAGPANGHAPVFLAAYLDVVAVITNLESSDRRYHLHVAQLNEALAAVGLAPGQRTWRAPPEASGTAIAL